MKVPRKLLNRTRWRGLAAERGEEIASFTIVDELIRVTPYRTSAEELQSAIGAMLEQVTEGRVKVRLVPDDYPTCYRIAGETFALEAA